MLFTVVAVVIILFIIVFDSVVIIVDFDITYSCGTWNFPLVGRKSKNRSHIRFLNGC